MVGVMAKKKPQTIERVLIGPGGEMAVGIRLRFFDKYHCEPIAALTGYEIRLEPSGVDAWAICNSPDPLVGPWVMVSADNLKECEDLGEL